MSDDSAINSHIMIGNHKVHVRPQMKKGKRIWWAETENSVSYWHDGNTVTRILRSEGPTPFAAIESLRVLIEKAETPRE